MKKEKVITIRVIATVIFTAILYYLFLPALNITSFDFWLFVFLVFGFYLFTGILGILGLTDIMVSSYQRGDFVGLNRFFNFNRKYYIYLIFPAIFLGIITVNLICSPVFMSKTYANRIEVKEDHEFTKDIQPVDFKSLPLLDRDSSEKLGDRVMGQMPEFVSQFYVSNLYTQINYNNQIIRVTPLEYMDIIKYIANYQDGIPAYITVNSVTGEAKLVKLNQGMKYMPSAYLNKNLKRKLRFSYPTVIFDKPNFELDEKGNPYWIVPTVKYIGVGMKKEITGVVILDPITGKSKKYTAKDVPSWVDHVYSADLLIKQLDDWGTYQKGFFNSIFGQKGVINTSDGYNYMIMNDDVYMYTGVTSVTQDASNLGFILTNMRTKDTHFYKAPGAEEYSAMASAEGQVQQMKYRATFPLLINLNNRPTYLMSLKDNAGLVKMYAFVDVADYQKVVVTDAVRGIEVAAKNYLGDSEIYSDSKPKDKEITIKSITDVVINGTTYYYITDNDDKRYRASIKLEEDKLPFYKEGDKIKISYKNETNVTEINSIE